MQITTHALRETWLRPNQRALWFGMVLPGLGIAVGAWLMLGAAEPAPTWRVLGGVLLTGFFGWMAGALFVEMRRPRIAYRAGEVLFYLRAVSPINVPVDVVEAFFIGQQSLNIAGRPSGSHATVNLVARFSQRATDWHDRDVKPALGRWREGYVVINGAWCEPITGDLIRRLNHRLREIHEERNAPSAPRVS